MSEYQLLGISGSLRKNSYNTALLQTAGDLLPDSFNFQLLDLSPIPLFNEDLVSSEFPQTIENLREQVRQASGLLVATPEYNNSIPGVLKNAIDWLSCSPDSPLEGKPVAIMGASTSHFGTVRAQMHLRQVFSFTKSMVINKPEVMIMDARSKFDECGKLVDGNCRRFLAELIGALQNQITNPPFMAADSASSG